MTTASYSTELDTDYWLSDESVSFAAGDVDGTTSCITIGVICDTVIEGAETAIIALSTPSDSYRVDVGGNYFSMTTVIMADNSECNKILLW